MLTYNPRFLRPRDLTVSPECLQNLDHPDILQMNTNCPFLDLVDLGTIDETNDDTRQIDPHSNMENFTPIKSNELVRASTDRHEDMTVSQADEKRKRVYHRQTSTIDAPRLQANSENSGGTAEGRVRGRKVHSCGEHFLSEEFSKTQMAQLQELAEKTAAVQLSSKYPSPNPQSIIIAAFALNMGRSSSLKFLKDLVEGYRKNGNSVRHTPDSDPMHMSPACRMLKINTLDCQIVFHCFLRTYHLYKLISENKYGLQEAESSFIVSSIKRPASPTTRKRGNPRQQQRAQLCKLMMRDLFPHLSEDNPSYDRKYRETVNIRKISLRLGHLVSHFGVGLFGLVPLESTPTDPMTGLLNHS